MTASKERSVGLIGLGLLGSAIGERLLSSGYEVTGFDVESARITEFEEAGGVAAANCHQLLQANQLVVLCLPSSEVVVELIQNYADDFSSGQVVIDTTTGDPQQMMAAGDRLGELGVSYVEANVAGSSVQMRCGQATLLVGGDRPSVSRIEPLLKCLASQHFHLGQIGAGSKMKLVHNLVLGLNRAVLAEGLVFAESLGIDSKRALEVLQQTPAASEVMQTKGQRMVEQEFDPQARLAQHRKDVGLILNQAELMNCQTPLSVVHQQLLDRAIELNLGELDNSAIIEVFRKLSGTDQ